MKSRLTVASPQLESPLLFVGSRRVNEMLTANRSPQLESQLLLVGSQRVNEVPTHSRHTAAGIAVSLCRALDVSMKCRLPVTAPQLESPLLFVGSQRVNEMQTPSRHRAAGITASLCWLSTCK